MAETVFGPVPIRMWQNKTSPCEIDGWAHAEFSVFSHGFKSTSRLGICPFAYRDDSTFAGGIPTGPQVSDLTKPSRQTNSIHNNFSKTFVM